MDAATVIAVIALVFSAISLVYLIKREGRDTLRFKQEQKDRAQKEKLGLSAIYQEGPTPTARGNEYRYGLVNSSDVPIDNPAGWFVDENGVEASEHTYGEPAYLMPKQRGELRLATARVDRPLTLHLEWLAVGVEHEKTSGADVPVERA